MSKVFVTQKTEHTLVGADRYGELVYLLPESKRVRGLRQPHVHALRKELRDYDAEHDYLLPVGDPAAIGVIIALAAQASLGRVRLLKWDREARDYYVVELDLLDRVPESVS